MTRVAALASIALTVGAIAGCARPAVSDVRTDGAEVYSDLVGRIYGTAEQRDAGKERQHYAWQAALGACMTSKGVPFTAPAWTPGSSTASAVSPGDVLAFSPRRDGYGIAGRVIDMAKDGPPGNAALDKLTGHARARWLKVQKECNPATTATEEQHLSEGMIPLDTKFVPELFAIQEELAPTLRSDYTACMAKAGLPGVQELADAYGWATRKFPHQALAADVKDPAAVQGFAEAAAFEKQVTAADWKCRGAESTRVIAASGARLSAWATANRAEIDKVAVQWAKMPAARDAAKARAMKIS
ncbi:hypothetical protein OWR29_17320 [Actinoplanes sp. Pm04-4]|uniref:Lipoprotein n=1 Tax=Paractinoplanes pyxinae TaxID=2997416 RepID=A0ABT4AZU9_9ACTN|nr:hypothetical protein [Actinoplanes pyxinae]MCY1139764.1 hypothetical protein [Actinoplanes pyxinae]